MERFLPSASGWPAAGLKPCGEPTCKCKSQLVTSVHQCPCGDPCMGFVVGDKTTFVAHENHSIEHNRVISNHSRTPLSYEDVVQQHHSFRSTAVVQFGRSGEVDFFTTKKKKTFNHLQRCGDHFFGVFMTCLYSCCNGASFDVGYVSVDPGEGELPSPES